MKRILTIFLAIATVFSLTALFSSCNDKETTGGEGETEKKGKIIVSTNAFFAPFEYYEGEEIVGVDVEIMEKVGEKLNSDVRFDNGEFTAIIDNVAAGKVCDCGAAGITITDERKEKVDFSTPYYTSVQYVIYAKDDDGIETVDDKYILWNALEGKKIGTQLDTTGWIAVDEAVDGGGVLSDTDAKHTGFDNAQLAADAIGANQIDVVVVDELPAQYIVSKNDKYVCLPLYSEGEDGEDDAPVKEEYAICVTKGNDKLLNAINEVLEKLLVEDDAGENEIERLVMKHMGLE